MDSIIIASTNLNKIDRIKALLRDTNIKIQSLSDLGLKNLVEPDETANTCVGIAAQKALMYVEQLKPGVYVLTQDDTLKLLGVKEKDNPKTSIKQPVIERFGKFNDEYAVRYYSELAKKYGGKIPIIFEYGHSMAIKTSDPRSRIFLVSSYSTLEARITCTPNGLDKVPGYFLSALLQVKIKNRWLDYTTLIEKQKVDVDSDLKKSILGLVNSITSLVYKHGRNYEQT